jgi:hypothetical protein
MKPDNRPARSIIAYSTVVAFSAAVALGVMLVSPSEPGNAVLLGLSPARLALAFGLLFAVLGFAALGIRSAANPAWAARTLQGWLGGKVPGGIALWLGGISFGLGWIGVFLPSYRVGSLGAYWLRLRPVMAFFLLTGFATLILWYAHRRRPARSERFEGTLRLSLALFILSLLPMLDVLLAGFRVHSSEDFWYGAGVPILVQQLIVAIAGGLLFLQVERKWDAGRLDLLTVVLVFAVTAFVWAREPLQQGFSFVSQPPNDVLYPIYDAAAFDIGSQFSLIGQKINVYGSLFFERPLYPAFLTYLHAALGQNYETLMAGQAAVFAIFPALVYLIGRFLGFRSAGFAGALVAMFRGVNAIAASNMIDLAGPKMILTDFPAAIGLALVTLAVCVWLKKSGHQGYYALWVGGALGFTLMLRINALILLAPIALFALIRFYGNGRRWLFHPLLVVLATLVITLPWELRNLSLGGQMYGSIVGKLRAVIDQRYTTPPDPGEPAPSIPITQSYRALQALYLPQEPFPFEAGCDSAACFVPRHFLHNMMTSILILPTSPVMDDLRVTVRENHPYWYPAWDGRFSLRALSFFLLNLFLIVTGIAAAWKRTGLIGLAPFAIFLFHNLSNALARTSGGRYIVPADWIAAVYFLIGIVYFAGWVMEGIGVRGTLDNTPLEVETRKKNNGALAAVKILILLAGFGSLLPLSENLFGKRYAGLDAARLLDERRGTLEAMGLGASSLDAFLQNENAGTFVGRALYPRYYKMNQGATSKYPNLSLPFPRLTFNLIGPDGQQNAVLPGTFPSPFPHAADVLVLGCKAQEHLDVLALIVLEGSRTVYVRSPESELTCPLEQPVCNNNSVCR